MKKLQRSFLVVGGLMALLVLAATPAFAIPVTITNSSFESPKASAGHGSLTIAGWTKSVTGTAGIWHATLPVPDGVQYAYSQNGATISQELLSTTIQAGATYTLDSYVRRYNSTSDAYTVALYAVHNGVDELLEKISGVSNYRVWTQVFAPAYHATSKYAGDHLKIILSGSAHEIDFDKVQLDYVAAVPIPAAFVLFGTGLLGLAGLRGLKKKSA